MNDREGDVVIKIKLPSNSIVMKLSEDSTVIDLLLKVCHQVQHVFAIFLLRNRLILQLEPNKVQYFDISYGFPLVKLSEKVSMEEVKEKLLKDVGIVPNSTLTIRLLS